MTFILDNKTPTTKSEKVRSFIHDTGLPLNRAPEALGLSPSDFMSWWSGEKPKLIQKKQISSLGQFLNIEESQILTGTYDKNFIRSVLFLGEEALPEKYSYNQFSYLRSSAHIIKFVTMSRGQHFSDSILRKMNISPLIYSDMNNRISLNYFMDLLDLLASSGLTQDELDNLSCVMFLSLGRSPLGEKFKTAKTYQECYSILSNNALLFDSNFEYKFEIRRDRIQITAFLPFENHTHMNWSEVKLERLFRYRQILMGWFPYLSKLPPIFPKCSHEYKADGILSTYTMDLKESGSSLLFCLPNN